MANNARRAAEATDVRQQASHGHRQVRWRRLVAPPRTPVTSLRGVLQRSSSSANKARGCYSFMTAIGVTTSLRSDTRWTTRRKRLSAGEREKIGQKRMSEIQAGSRIWRRCCTLVELRADEWIGCSIIPVCVITSATGRWQCANTVRWSRSCDLWRWLYSPSGSQPASSGSCRRSGRTTTRGCRACRRPPATPRRPSLARRSRRRRRVPHHWPRRSRDCGVAATLRTTRSALGSGTTTSSSKDAFQVPAYLFYWPHRIHACTYCIDAACSYRYRT